MNFSTNKTAFFLHCPYGADSARIDTMPFAVTLISDVSRYFNKLYIHSWEKRNTKSCSLYSSFLSNCTFIFRRYALDRQIWPLDIILLFLQLLPSFIFYRPSHVFVLGQKGVIVCSWILNFSPFTFRIFYLNDEFPNAWPSLIHNKAEIKSLSSVNHIILPDITRKLHFLSDIKSLVVHHSSSLNI